MVESTTCVSWKLARGMDLAVLLVLHRSTEPSSRFQNLQLNKRHVVRSKVIAVPIMHAQIS